MNTAGLDAYADAHVEYKQRGLVPRIIAGGGHGSASPEWDRSFERVFHGEVEKT